MPAVAGKASSSVGYQEARDGSASDDESVVTEQAQNPEIYYFRAESHISEVGTSVMEAGDIADQPDSKPIEKTFAHTDWNQKRVNTLIKGDWRIRTEPPERGMAFGIENINFGQRRRGSDELMRVCEVLRKGGSQVITLQECNDVLMRAVLEGGRIAG